MLNNSLKYALVTPARNEAAFIETTIRSVIAQTVRPIIWVVVSDGSTDGTDDIVRKYAANHPWIELLRMPERRERDFAGKVHAFNAGYDRIRDLDYDVIGNLDADISFDEEYFFFLLQKLAEDPALGLVGTRYKDLQDNTYDYRFVSADYVSGACQVFRRACFEQIGGYVPVKGGAVDRIITIAARTQGWRTQTFMDKTYLHHRQTGTAQESVLMARFRAGAKDHSVGSHPVWELFRALYQMSKRPFLVGGLTLAAGYLWALIRGGERPVSREMIQFTRKEQMQRLKSLLTGGVLRARHGE